MHDTASRGAGIEMDIISKTMEHASVAVTEDIYAQITSSIMEEAAQKSRTNFFRK